MQRWERTHNNQQEFWEIEIEETTLKERSGSKGKTTQHREQLCDSKGTAEAILRRLVSQKERQGFRCTKTDEAPKPNKLVPYPGLSDKALAGLILQLEKIAAQADDYKIGATIEQSTRDWRTRHQVLWHLVAHRLIKAEESAGMLLLLCQDPLGAPPEVVASLFARLPASLEKVFGYELCWFTDFVQELDALLFLNYQRAPALFDAHEKDFPKNVQRALDCIRGRLGQTLPKALLETIATNQATGSGLAMNCELLWVEDNQTLKKRLSNPEAVREVALRFGTRAEWDKAIVKAALKNKWESITAIPDALRACSPLELAALLARPFSFSTNDNLALELRILEERRDPPEALLEAANSLKKRTDHGKEIKELLAVIAARRFGEQKKPVPKELDALLRFELFSGVYHESIQPYVEGLKAIPKARVHKMAKRLLASDFEYPKALGALLAHPDDALLWQIFEKDTPRGYLEREVVAHLGAAALPHLERIWPNTPKSAKRSRHQQILAALSHTEAPLAPKWDSFLTFDQLGEEELTYWSSSDLELRQKIFVKLPVERQRALICLHTKEDQHPERALQLAHLLPDQETVDEAVRNFVSHRERSELYQVEIALRSLGSRAVAALVERAPLLAKDEELLERLQRIFSEFELRRIQRAMKK